MRRNGMSGGERAGVETMTFKQGDAVMVGPFTIEQFRDTWLPGPQDDGNTAILSRDGLYGVLSPDLSRLIPHSDALPAVARWLSETPNAVDRLWHVLDIYGNSAHAEFDAEQVLSSLLAALTGGGD